jgi:hypothetical protein
VEKLEPDRDAPQALRVGVANDEEVIGANTTPPVSRLRGDSREGEDSDQNEGNGSFYFHNRSDGLQNSIRISEAATQSMTGFQD